MALKNSRRWGFTMVEVLVVMAIIVFLASLSFWGLSQIRKNMRIRQTSALVERVSSAIRNFRTQYLEWPKETDMAVLGMDWYDFLNNGYTQMKLPSSNQSKYEYRGPWLELNDSELNSKREIIDVWGSPVAILIDTVANTLLVYSLGPNGTCDDGHFVGDGCPDGTHDDADDIVAK
jgi:prepilin-type N-terminal cleavage/methylation domain-containing protein